MGAASSSQVTFTYLDRDFSFTGQPGEYVFERLKKQGEFYENDLLETIGESLFSYEGDIVDVGANLGNHTVYFGAVLNRKVLAFEPEPLNFEFLRANIRKNGLKDSALAYNVAAWDKHEKVSLKQNVEQNFGTFSVVEKTGDIEAAPLDDYLENRRVALIKIDVEGAELNVLNGLVSTIKKSRPIITVEAHTSKDRSEQIAFFEERNYRSVDIEGRSDNFIWCPEENLNFQRMVARIGVQKQRELEKDVRQLRSKQGLVLRRTLKIQKHVEKMLAMMGGVSHQLTSVSEHDVDPQKQFNELLKMIETAESDMEEGLVAVRQKMSEPAQDDSEASVLRGVEEFGNQGSATADSIFESSNMELDEVLRSSFEPPLRALRKVHSNAIEFYENFDHESDGQSSEHEDWDDSDPEVQGQSRQTTRPEAEVNSGLSRMMVDINQKHQVTVAMLRELQRKMRDLNSTAAQVATSPAKNHELSNTELLMSEISKLAFLLEKSDPELWNAENLTNSVDSKLQRISSIELGGAAETRPYSGESTTPLFTGPGKGAQHGDRVRVGVASMPGREAGLRRVLEIMSDQADEIFVYLNNMTSVPESCRGFSNVSFFTGPDLGDRGKFAFMEGFSGYYLTVDDDIEYAPFHVQHIIDGIERYGRNAIVGWHGSIFSDDFEEFYNAKYRKVLSFRFLRGKDTQVHLLGTGVSGFHTDSIGISLEDFLHPNMADVFLAIEAQRQNIPMMVLAHEKDWAKPIDVGPSISTVSMKKDEDEAGGLDVAATVSTLVKEYMPWKMPDVNAVYTREPFTVAFIGRTDKERWKKGGILKSAHLTVTALARFGVRTVLEDIETGDPRNLSGNKADIVMVYVGDPERPDFKNVEEIVALHANAGKQVIVNLSINGMSHRSVMVAEKIKEWDTLWPNQIWLMVFTQAAFQIPELEQIKQRLLLVPKTIALPRRRVSSFAESEGIFIGDIGKLNNDSLLDYAAEEWIAAIREALPGIKIYAVKQYKPALDKNLDIDEVWEFLRGDEFAERIGQRRLMVTPIKYATFEMVPLEVAALGIPVVYPEMPQSLSEHLGGAGVVARSPQELKQVLPLLYRDPIVWKGLSQAGLEKAESAELGRASSQLYLQLAKLLRTS